MDVKHTKNFAHEIKIFQQKNNSPVTRFWGYETGSKSIFYNNNAQQGRRTQWYTHSCSTNTGMHTSVDQHNDAHSSADQHIGVHISAKQHNHVDSSAECKRTHWCCRPTYWCAQQCRATQSCTGRAVQTSTLMHTAVQTTTYMYTALFTNTLIYRTQQCKRTHLCKQQFRKIKFQVFTHKPPKHQFWGTCNAFHMRKKNVTNC